MVTIELKNLTKRFGEITAAKNITLTIKDGEFFTLLGPSGCGKTTTMRIIAGLEFPTEGQVFFNGTDVTNLPSYERNTGMVFQNYALWPHMKVFDNVAYGLNVRSMPQNEVKEKVNRAYRELGKRAKIPGFRPGKIPRNILERYFGKEVLEDLKRDLLESA